MQRIQQIIRSIMIAVLLCAGILICANDPGLNARKVTGWNMALGQNSEASRHTGWTMALRGMAFSEKGDADMAFYLEEPRRIVRE